MANGKFRWKFSRINTTNDGECKLRLVATVFTRILAEFRNIRFSTDLIVFEALEIFNPLHVFTRIAFIDEFLLGFF
jgi:hypothetical protein